MDAAENTAVKVRRPPPLGDMMAGMAPRRIPSVYSIPFPMFCALVSGLPAKDQALLAMTRIGMKQVDMAKVFGVSPRGLNVRLAAAEGKLDKAHDLVHEQSVGVESEEGKS